MSTSRYAGIKLERTSKGYRYVRKSEKRTSDRSRFANCYTSYRFDSDRFGRACA